ncbi:MAG: hypothetical protein ABIS47_03920 [Acidimicrobiales bacterium]
MTGVSSLAFVTIVSKNYLSFARVLVAGLQRHHPDADCFVALADEVEGRFEPEREAFTLLHLADLAIADLEGFRFRHGHPILAVAAKPFVLAHLLGRGYRTVVFLDADMLVLADLAPLVAAATDHAIVLTPHLLEPPSGPDAIQRELQILRSGGFNGGVVSVSDTTEARHFLDWWQDRVRERCEHDVAHGMFLDQRWLDLAPSYFADLHVLTDPSINVAYWNLDERSLAFSGVAVQVDGGPCRLLHASGFDPGHPHRLTRHGPAAGLSGRGAVGALFARYRSLLEEAGHQETSGWPYAYAAFSNGIRIPDLARRIHRDLGPAARRFGDPADAGGPASYFAWLTAPREDSAGSAAPLTPLWQAIWESRPDVRRAFPDPAADDQEGFLRWLRASAGSEHGLAPELLPAPS